MYSGWFGFYFKRKARRLRPPLYTYTFDLHLPRRGLSLKYLTSITPLYFTYRVKTAKAKSFQNAKSRFQAAWHGAKCVLKIFLQRSTVLWSTWASFAAGLLHRIVRRGVGVVLNCRIVKPLARARPRSERPVSLTNPISIFLDILIARARTRGPC